MVLEGGTLPSCLIHAQAFHMRNQPKDDCATKEGKQF
jgi:hypothetical protein